MRLQDKRIAAKMSQSQLAAAAGISLQVLQKYECGFRRIDGASVETLCAIANALKVNLWEIVESDDLMEKIKRAVSYVE